MALAPDDRETYYSHIADGNVKYYRYSRKQFDIYLKNETWCYHVYETCVHFKNQYINIYKHLYSYKPKPRSL
jgi:hypothetical protein